MREGKRKVREREERAGEKEVQEKKSLRERRDDKKRSQEENEIVREGIEEARS